MSVNATIVDELQKLTKNISDIHRIRSINNAVKVIKKYPKKITAGEQLRDIKGIGKGIIRRVNEILTNGYLSEIKPKSHLMLTDIIGIGDATATSLREMYNIKTPEQLINAYNSGKIELNHTIKLGLKYYKVYKQKIPRDEVKQIEEYLSRVSAAIMKEARLTLCGSYRRGKAYSNDIDCLICHESNYLKEFIEILSKKNFLVDDMTVRPNVKYMGFCKHNRVIRRIDIRYTTPESYYAALLYFTGSGEFNKKMREHANVQGYKLNEYGLYKYTQNKYKMVDNITSERKIFEILGLKYVRPEDRD